MPTEEMARAILDAVDAQLDEQIALTRALVACKSFSAREGDAQTLMRDELARRGYEVDSWAFRAADLAGMPGYSPAVLDYDQTFNVVGTLPAAGTGRSLILNGHVDVVPVGDERRWSQDPFEPRIADGRLYGRGSGDMKAGVVANLFAVEAVRRAGLRPAGRIHLLSVVDEESSGNGTLACVARGYTADAAIIPEPTSNALVTAQIGILWFDLTVEGDPQHASGFQGRGANAIEKAYDLVRALKRLEEACNRPERRHPLYTDHPHPIRLNIGRITGGDWHSSVPASCHVGGRLGVYPDQDPEEVMAQIRSCIEAASRDDAYLREHPPVLSFTGNQFAGYEPRGAEALGAVLADAHRRVTGAAIERVALPYGSDARVLGLCAGIPSLLYGPHCERAHGIDECVDLESVRTLTRTLALVVARWCGVEPAAAP